MHRQFNDMRFKKHFQMKLFLRKKNAPDVEGIGYVNTSSAETDAIIVTSVPTDHFISSSFHFAVLFMLRLSMLV